jgi:hypothetical protein
LAHARRVWATLVGPELAKVSRPVAIQRKVLLIGVTHQVAGQDVKLRRAAILAALAAEFGEAVVEDVRPVPRRRLGEGVVSKSPVRRAEGSRGKARGKPARWPRGF